MFRYGEMLSRLISAMFRRVGQYVKNLLRPVRTASALAGAAWVEAVRPRAALLAENALLRQQVLVLRRAASGRRPRLHIEDRLFLGATCPPQQGVAPRASRGEARHAPALASRLVHTRLASTFEGPKRAQAASPGDDRTHPDPWPRPTFSGVPSAFAASCSSSASASASGRFSNTCASSALDTRLGRPGQPFFGTTQRISGPARCDFSET